MIRIEEKKVLSSDQKHMLIGKVYIPDGTPKGLFQVVHGMTEHIGRYASFMERMAEEGYVVFGYDHLGHGQTALQSDGVFGYFAGKDGWKYLYQDAAVFAEAMQQEYRDFPWILMGHSMGSFIVRLTAAYAKTPDKLIVMGTSGSNPSARAGIALADVIGAVKGGRYYSEFLDKLTFSDYNSHFSSDSEQDGNNWLTKDESIRKMKKHDPISSFKFSVSAMGDLIRLNYKANAKEWFSTMGALEPVLPILLVSGTDDPVGSYGDGVREVHKKLAESGCLVRMILYSGCRHEILNDTCRENVISDILQFAKMD